MDGRHGIVFLKLLPLFFAALSVCNASGGDKHPHFRSCTEICEKTGSINKLQVPVCKDFDKGVNPVFERAQKWSLSVVFEKWDCRSECRYQCMKDTESKRQAFSQPPLKYYGKWPFLRFLSIQEPASVIFSILNLVAHWQGLSSYYRLAYYKLPRRSLGGGIKAPYYEFTGMWIAYAALAINSWFWSVLFHARVYKVLQKLVYDWTSHWSSYYGFEYEIRFLAKDVLITERLDYSSAVALLGFTLAITIIRVGSLRVEAAQVMVAAPIIAFTTTHIMYLNFYDFDYGLNMKICIIMGVAQLLLWTLWAGATHHPSRSKLWFVVFGTVLSMFLEIFDFPPFWGVLDAHALWHACTVPITMLWWGFIKEDVSLRTALLQRSSETDERKEK